MPKLNHAYFLGVWVMDRLIDDKAAQKTASLKGQAVFTARDEGLGCVETGALLLEGESFPSSRRTLWQFVDNRVEVRYEDGRPFHTFTEAKPGAQHMCESDLYAVTYEFAPGRWRSYWSVKGPQKNYEMTTQYSRQVLGEA